MLEKCFYGFSPGGILGLLADEDPVLDAPDANGDSLLVITRRKVGVETRKTLIRVQ